MLQKTNRVLQIILSGFLLIAFRVWHLAVLQRDEKLVEAQKPQQRVVLQRAERGIICDRFGIPLAKNRICYQASIYYAQLAQIPSISWKKDSTGKRIRTYPRKEYITQLSSLLGAELSLDPVRIEDEIYAKAALFPHVPFAIKSRLTEKEYYRIKFLERDWMGLQAELGSERYYPLGKTACHILGHLGAINHREYLQLASELDMLRSSIEKGCEDASMMTRYFQLCEKAYTVNDLVGKAGIEKSCEQSLRGLYGKKRFEINKKGDRLKELLGSKEAISGETVVLSLSAELQQFCESLLIQDEGLREGKSTGIDPLTKKRAPFKTPWIKGGAIAVLDPNTGEVLALASTPRFDPNDFVSKRSRFDQIHRWHETESFLGALWDGRDCLYRESCAPGGEIQEQKEELAWDKFLFFTLPAEHPLFAFFQTQRELKKAIQLQEDFDSLLYYANSPQPALLMDLLFPKAPLASSLGALEKENASRALTAHTKDIAPLRHRIESALTNIPSNKDKLFALDLIRTAVYSPAFTDELIVQMGSLTLSSYRSLTQALQRLETHLKEACKERFHNEDFLAWREANQREFLQKKRNLEREKKTYARPYLDYLDSQERVLFEEFWKENRLALLAAHLFGDLTSLEIQLLPYAQPSLFDHIDVLHLRTACSPLDLSQTMQFLRTMRSFSELDRPLWGFYPRVKGAKGAQREKDLAASAYPREGFGFTRSYAFQTGGAPGSIFKLITAYEALRQREERKTLSESLNPLMLFDEVHIQRKAPPTRSMIVGYTKDRKPLYRYYKGGRLPRSHLANVGEIDLIGAIEQSSNPYFALLAGDFFTSPEDLNQAASQFGLGEKTNIEIPGEYRGALPKDLLTNRTGLYSASIGQHTLLITPLQAAAMLVPFAKNGEYLTPRLIHSIHGSRRNNSPLTGFCSPRFFAKKELSLLGIDFPLFTAELTKKEEVEESQQVQPEVRRTLPLSSAIRQMILTGMDQSIWSARGSARPSAIRSLHGKPLLLREFLSLKHQMLGKTGTAEVFCNHFSVPSSTLQMITHIWFGAISFLPPPVKEERDSHSLKKEQWNQPELVIAIYLRYGSGGKEAAPIASQIIGKWREICASHEKIFARHERESVFSK